MNTLKSILPAIGLIVIQTIVSCNASKSVLININQEDYSISLDNEFNQIRQISQDSIMIICKSNTSHINILGFTDSVNYLSMIKRDAKISDLSNYEISKYVSELENGILIEYRLSSAEMDDLLIYEYQFDNYKNRQVIFSTIDSHESQKKSIKRIVNSFIRLNN